MITVHREALRREPTEDGQDTWLSCVLGDATSNSGYRNTLREGRLSLGESFRHWRSPAELVTYVRQGTMAYQDPLGRVGLVEAGEFQRMTVSGRAHYSARNASPTSRAHVFQIWFYLGSEKHETCSEKSRFSVAERRGGLVAVASPDGRGGSLKLHQNAFVYSEIVEAGRHVAHETAPERRAWLHVVAGELNLQDTHLSAGDAAAMNDATMLSFTATAPSEILLVEWGDPAE